MRCVWAWGGAGLLGVFAGPGASAAAFSGEVASLSEVADRPMAEFARAPVRAGRVKAVGGWPPEPFGAVEVSLHMARGAGRMEVAGAVEFSSRHAPGAARQADLADGGLAGTAHGLDLSPLTTEDMVLDPVRYRISGTLATTAGSSALWNGAAVVAEFSPGPNDGFEPNRWQWGRCRTGLSRC